MRNFKIEMKAEEELGKQKRATNAEQQLNCPIKIPLLLNCDEQI